MHGETSTRFRFGDFWPRKAPGIWGLPPGQRVVRGFPRFGDGIAPPLPEIPETATLAVTGAVDTPLEIPLTALAQLPRREMVSDFHCVTTWMATSQLWRSRMR